MAFMDQARKSTLTAACKVALAKWPGVKWTLSVRHHSTIVLTIAKGDIDFEEGAILAAHRDETDRLRDGYADVNVYSIDRDWRGEAAAFLAAAKDALMVGNHNRSDVQADYHDVGWYVDISVGRWNKPYLYTRLTTGEPLTAAEEKLIADITAPAAVAPAPAMAIGAAVHEAAAAQPGEACPECGEIDAHEGLCAGPANDATPLHPKPMGIDEMHDATSSPEALIERASAVAAEMFGAPETLAQAMERRFCVTLGDDGIRFPAPVEPPAPVRAMSFLSPIELIGAEQHEADYLGACIDNLVGPVRRGELTARQALERVARTAFQAGFTAGDRYARKG